ncbi:signal transduction protein (EAL/GGDEF domain protein) [Legionella beliardensis]|uniref:Signal transduction protein (EAL/GGDEF domain protein) n=1 Tax=Legionella beliardensis TaxID=91822 RepID=A0A378JPR4_9GAMM|nr:EAL domain-containing protein [Legionella beliardensis]STX55755.1 signal transduction protein (EAL/GGDEF domain protein) [Legionella beliardensis]
MTTNHNHHLKKLCKICQLELDFDFTFAFQPIIDIGKQEVFAYEALVRGKNGEGAAEILAQVTDENRYRFDQECRIRSIYLAQKLNITSYLSINFLPNAIYSPELCIRTTIQAAELANFPLEKIIFEVAESEQIHEPEKLLGIFQYYQAKGFKTAIDDFGAGFAGLGLLANFQPNYIKIDLKLIRDIDTNTAKQATVKGILLTANLLNIQVIAEGIENLAEAQWLQQEGIILMQGFYFSKPGFECLPKVIHWL